MTSSIDMPPFTEAYWRLFFRSQLGTKPVPPPKGLDLTGHTGIVTGSNTGIGLESVRILLHHKLSRVIMAVRSIKKGEIAAAKLKKSYPNANIEVWALDMSSYESIQAFVRRCDSLERIDFVMLNAGLYGMAFNLIPSTGHEETFQVNYLSTTLLTILLLPVLKAKRPQGKPAHLSITGSALAYTTPFSNQDADPLIPSFDSSKNWGVSAAGERYSVSKLLLMMFVAKMRDCISADDVVINLIEPGWTKGTDLSKSAPAAVKLILWFLQTALARNPTQAAWTYIDALVVKGKESHGCWLYNWKVAPFPTMMYTPAGKNVAEKLWKETLDELEFAHPKVILSSMA